MLQHMHKAQCQLYPDHSHIQPHVANAQEVAHCLAVSDNLRDVLLQEDSGV